MNKESQEFLDQAIRIEINMSELYRDYAKLFPDDEKFWRQLAKEESEHAALLGLAKELADKFPPEILQGTLDTLLEMNGKIRDTIEEYRQNRPSRKEAYSYAVELEQSAYEVHYQRMMDSDAESEAMKRFQSLNVYDKDHAKRILLLLEQ